LENGERRGLVVKRLRLSTDWTARRTSDRRGREAAMLGEPALASRLTRTKEEALARYRQLLSERIPAPLPDSLWEELVQVGLLTGARMLLWSKALAVEAGRPGARAEWDWWAERLDAAAG